MLLLMLLCFVFLLFAVDVDVVPCCCRVVVADDVVVVFDFCLLFAVAVKCCLMSLMSSVA